MSKNKLIVLLGFFVALMPFLGIPQSWKTILLVVLGLIIVVLAFLLQREVGGKKTDVYVENAGTPATSPPSSNQTHTIPVNAIDHAAKKGK